MRTRRRFLAQTVIAVAGTTMIPSALAQNAPLAGRPIRRTRAVSLDQLAFEDFERLVDSAFVVRSDTGASTVVLAKAERGVTTENLEGPRLDTFSLEFEHGTGELLGQGTYRFYHSRVGEFGMFIVPVERSAAGQAYEAVFNRLIG